MESDESTKLDERLKSLLSHLYTESGILDRLVYKNKNQHRRCPYFQLLLKVRRDLKLFHSAGLSEILTVMFQVIDGKKPAQKAFLPKKHKKNNPKGKHNYQERLLGVARLLSQMSEPILNAAMYPYILAEYTTIFSLKHPSDFFIAIINSTTRDRVQMKAYLDWQNDIFFSPDSIYNFNWSPYEDN